MQTSAFTSATGRLVRTLQGYTAFVPDPLPPRLEATWDLVVRLSEADRAMSELGGLARNLPNPHPLIGPFVRREAVLSSRIEGTQASLSDLLVFEATGESEQVQPPDVGEVANYVRALEYGLERVKQLPLSLRLIREMHGILMEGVRGHSTAGEFRKTQNWIGPPGATLADATFVPPPPNEMHEALNSLEQFLHAAAGLPPLVRMATVHYQFEAVHPFVDGSGRIGRLLISLMLVLDDLLPQPLLYLSAFFERHRSDYYRLLLAVSQEGRWSEWIDFFLRGVTEQSRDAIWRTEELLRLWQSYRQLFEAARYSALLLRAIDDLFERPVTTISSVARRFDVTPRAARLNVDKLVQAGILREITGRQRNRVYAATKIIDLVQRSMREAQGLQDADIDQSNESGT